MPTSLLSRSLAAVALALVAASCLFPPWVERVNTASVRTSASRGRAWLFSPPAPGVLAQRASVTVDTTPLLLQLAALTAVAVAVWLLGEALTLPPAIPRRLPPGVQGPDDLTPDHCLAFLRGPLAPDERAWLTRQALTGPEFDTFRTVIYQLWLAREQGLKSTQVNSIPQPQ